MELQFYSQDTISIRFLGIIIHLVFLEIELDSSYFWFIQTSYSSSSRQKFLLLLYLDRQVTIQNHATATADSRKLEFRIHISSSSRLKFLHLFIQSLDFFHIPASSRVFMLLVHLDFIPSTYLDLFSYTIQMKWRNMSFRIH